MGVLFNSENHVKNLPDVYDKRTGSNNFKILEIERVACNDLRTALQEVDKILDLNQATGKTLDMYGKRVGQARGLATDAQYLYMIKSKIMRNVSNGSYNGVVNAICATFDCEPSEVLIVETDNPCTVQLVSIPLDVINKAGLTTSQVVALIKSILPVGITLETVIFEGTFCFSDIENEKDENGGFSNDTGTIGGYFGMIYGDENEIILPI